MMITDQGIAALCEASYAQTGGPLVPWDTWEDGTANNGVVYGIKVVDGIDVVIFRGSTTFLDWWCDLDIRSPACVEHPELGRLHQGFYTGMEETWRKIRARGTAQMIFAGHSLGAARANILTALARLDGIAPLRKVMFGEPKSGMPELAEITKAVPGASYRNGDNVWHDDVTAVPYYLPTEPWSHDRDLTLVRADPPAFHEWGFFAWHAIPLYVRALGGG
jgi:Lipase (class 3)